MYISGVCAYAATLNAPPGIKLVFYSLAEMFLIKFHKMMCWYTIIVLNWLGPNH